MLCDDLLNKLCFGELEAENGQENWFQKVELRLDVWASTDSQHALFLGLLKTVRVCVNWTKIVHMLCA